MKLSIVTTLYNSAPYLTEFYERASASAKQIAGKDYEIILVNDGSPDNSIDLAVDISNTDSHVIIVDLSRNFGHHKAIMTGLAYSKGEHVFLIDSDLEEDIEWLHKFASQMKKLKCDVIYGVQEQRKGKWIERNSGRFFYLILNTLTNLNLTENIVTARLMTRRYVNALLLHKEREILIAGLWQITGFDQRAQKVKKHSTSETTYKFTTKISHLINAVTSFSNIPLIIIFYIGLLICLVTFIFIIILFLKWGLYSKPISGWTSVISSIWLLGGMIISFIGVIGIYLSRIFIETKQRPSTIVKKVYSSRK